MVWIQEELSFGTTIFLPTCHSYDVNMRRIIGEMAGLGGKTYLYMHNLRLNDTQMISNFHNNEPPPCGYHVRFLISPLDCANKAWDINTSKAVTSRCPISDR